MVYFTVRNVHYLNKILNNLGGLNYSIQRWLNNLGRPHTRWMWVLLSQRKKSIKPVKSRTPLTLAKNSSYLLFENSGLNIVHKGHMGTCFLDLHTVPIGDTLFSFAKCLVPAGSHLSCLLLTDPVSGAVSIHHSRHRLMSQERATSAQELHFIL